MRRLIAIIVSLLLISAVLCSCNNGSSAETGIGGLTQLKNDNGDLTGYERRSYNDNGDVTRLDVYDTDQTYLYYILYEYDDDNRLFTETRYKAEGFAESRYVYTYDDNGNLSEKAYELPHGEAEVTRYDKDGNEIERLYYDIDEKLSKREVLENGKWVTYDNPTE